MIKVVRVFKEAFSGLPFGIWMLAAVTFVNRAGTMVLPFLALYITRDLGHDISFAGLAMGIYGVGALLGTWCGGKLTDRFGAFHVMVGSLLAAALMLIAFEHMRSVPTLLPGLFILGAVSEALRPAAGVMITESCPPQSRMRAFSLLRLAINLGVAFGPGIGGMMALKDYRWLFRIDGLTCAVAFVLMLFASKALRTLPTHHDDDQPTPAQNARQSTSPWHDPPFLIFLGLVVLVGALFFQIWSTYSVYLKESYGLTEFHYGLLMSGNGVLIICFEMVLTHLFQNRHPLRVVTIGVCFFTTALFIMPFGAGLAFATFSVLMWTFGEMLMSPYLSGFVANRAPKASRGDYMGLFNMAFSAAFITAPACGTYVYERFGGDTLWYGVGVLGLIGCVGFELLRRYLVLKEA